MRHLLHWMVLVVFFLGPWTSLYAQSSLPNKRVHFNTAVALINYTHEQLSKKINSLAQMGEVGRTTNDKKLVEVTEIALLEAEIFEANCAEIFGEVKSAVEEELRQKASPSDGISPRLTEITKTYATHCSAHLLPTVWQITTKEGRVLTLHDLAVDARSRLSLQRKVLEISSTVSDENLSKVKALKRAYPTLSATDRQRVSMEMDQKLTLVQRCNKKADELIKYLESSTDLMEMRRRIGAYADFCTDNAYAKLIPLF